MQEVLNGTGSYPINFGGGTSGTASGLMSKSALRQLLEDNSHLIWRSMEARLIEHLQSEGDGPFRILMKKYGESQRLGGLSDEYPLLFFAQLKD